MLRAAGAQALALAWKPAAAAAAGSSAGRALAGSPRGAAAASGPSGGIPTGPGGGYNDPEERSIAEESAQQLEQDRRAAERLAEQGGGVSDLSEGKLAGTLASESREAAAEHREDAGDASSQVEGDTLTDRDILEGKEQGQSTSV